MDVAITGSSGLIGTALVAELQKNNHKVIKLVRREPDPTADEIRWQPTKDEIDSESLEGIDAVIHLAGAGIGDKRWTKNYKKTLLESRTTSTTLLAKTLASAQKPPKVFLSGSAIGYYGTRGEEKLTEQSAPGENFLASLCVDWENATQSAIEAGIRTAFLRTGIVLTPAGGALAKMLPLFKLGLGGKFGSGKQYMSWISLDDEVAAIIHLLTSELSGAVNLTAPEPLQNKEFTKVLARTVNKPSFLPVPSFGPKMLLGTEMAQALLFDSQRVLPNALEKSGFSYKHPTLPEALSSLLKD